MAPVGEIVAAWTVGAFVANVGSVVGLAVKGAIDGGLVMAFSVSFIVGTPVAGGAVTGERLGIMEMDG